MPKSIEHHSEDTIQYAGKTRTLGAVEKNVNIFERFTLVTQEEEKMTAVVLLNKISEIGLAAKIDLSKTANGFKTIIFDKKSGAYIGVNVGQLEAISDGHIGRNVHIIFSGNREIKSTIQYKKGGKDSWILVPSESVTVFDSGNCEFQIYPNQCFRVWSENRNAVKKSPLNPAEAMRSAVQRIRGEFCDPLQELYGDLSEEEIIRKYLAENEIFDPVSKRIVRLFPKQMISGFAEDMQPAAVLDYKEFLDSAINKLKQELQKEDYGSLVNKLSAKRARNRVKKL